MAVWKKALFPFQIVFAGAVFLRKSLYKKGVFSRYTAPVPVIAIGNISTGGTGKTPMVDYLLTKFSKNHQLGILSRGYGRRSKGYLAVTPNTTADMVGDEPKMLAQKHPNIVVSVCEHRPNGLIQMLEDHPKIDAFFLDDALQHLRLKPSFKIVLTTFQDPWFSDTLLPVGNLREPASSAQQADVVVVTKCPATLAEETKKVYADKLDVLPSQQLFFTTLDYDTKVHGTSEMTLKEFIKKPFVLLTGIANPSTLCAFLDEKKATYTHQSFADHHVFTKSEIARLQKSNIPILTTEKDAVRLASQKIPQLFTLGIRVRFLEDEEKFLSAVANIL
ncbi:MAG: Tetraacyldisaccharide 4'-kinase [Bacteroidota bacterium]|nr:MAG: Tetraacyldisaccharide 4'-kinase [Bacteroidota bacterium]